MRRLLAVVLVVGVGLLPGSGVAGAAAGDLDGGFGDGESGVARTDLGTSGEWASSNVAEPDGGFVAAGTSGSSFALDRYADVSS